MAIDDPSLSAGGPARSPAGLSAPTGPAGGTDAQPPLVVALWRSRIGHRLLLSIGGFSLLILALVTVNAAVADRLAAAIAAQQRVVSDTARVTALQSALREREALELRTVNLMLVGDTVALRETQETIAFTERALERALENLAPISSAVVGQVSRELATVVDLPVDIAEAILAGDRVAARRLADRHGATFTGLQTALQNYARALNATADAAARQAAEAQRLNAVATTILALVALGVSIFGIAFGWLRVLRPLAEIGQGLDRLAGRCDGGDAEEGPARSSIGTVDEIDTLHRALRRVTDLEQDRGRRLAALELRDRAIGSSLDGMAILDADPALPILYVNPAFRRLLPEVAPDPVGTSALDALAPAEPPNSRPPQDGAASADGDREEPSARAAIAAAVADRVPVRLRLAHRRSADTIAWFDLILAPVASTEGGPIDHYIAILRDIGAQVRGETELREAIREAQAANGLKTLFLANISHEVRTPLNAILGFSDVLRQMPVPPTDPRYDDYLSEIYEAGASLLTTISRILDIARLESGDVAPKLEPVRLARVVEPVVESFAQPLDRSGLDIALSGPIRTAYALADRRLLRTAFAQLLGNAIRFSPRDGTIRLSCTADATTVTLSVEDQGSGMSEEQAAIAMTVFGQVRRTADYAGHGGLGLGLPIAQRIVDAHAGRLTLTSAPGGGTVATIAVPRAPTPNAAETVPA